jgi:hypothetical protein
MARLLSNWKEWQWSLPHICHKGFSL